MAQLRHIPDLLFRSLVCAASLGIVVILISALRLGIAIDLAVKFLVLATGGSYIFQPEIQSLGRETSDWPQLAIATGRKLGLSLLGFAAGMLIGCLIVGSQLHRIRPIALEILCAGCAIIAIVMIYMPRRS